MVVEGEEREKRKERKLNGKINGNFRCLGAWDSKVNGGGEKCGKLATEHRNRPQGALPSDTENHKGVSDKEHCKVVTLQSGKILEPKVVEVEDGPIDKEEVQP
ncbi:hypothetical protein EPI10_015786 [Gossypium australe]|uniref:Uncharacterized protein n=1 Tax=Gossypium australe TaxID=47621 RepID=A0A5B6VLX3_9ROSI|nr:hypothetical protein EPI10_015786 [Gossypium australe]